MINIAISSFLASLISSNVISLTCDIEPGAELILSLYKVWIESITIVLYSFLATSASIDERSISVSKNRLSLLAFRRSALNLI